MMQRSMNPAEPYQGANRAGSRRRGTLRCCTKPTRPIATPSRRRGLAAHAALGFRDTWLGGARNYPLARRLYALGEVFTASRITHRRPAFGITGVLSGNCETPVVEEVSLALPFGDLLHFAKPEVTAPQPRILVVAPLSGHFATLLRSTIATLLHDHDVYITDWKNARDVPLADGGFGFADYVDYVIRFLQDLGPGAHLLAVCQPCVQVLAAVAVMAENHDPCQPRSMSLMGGPIDTRESPTVVNRLATDRPLAWFAENLIYRVPLRYPGGGRRVYPGFIQLSAFMAMNLPRHFGQFRKLYQHIADVETEEVEKIEEFYDEYLAVLDLSAEFYLENHRHGVPARAAGPRRTHPSRPQGRSGRDPPDRAADRRGRARRYLRGRPDRGGAPVVLEPAPAPQAPPPATRRRPLRPVLGQPLGTTGLSASAQPGAGDQLSVLARPHCACIRPATR